MNATTDQMTQTNALMRLRETLMDHVESGEVVTLPQYIDVYPQVFMYEVAPGIVFLLIILFGGIALYSSTKRYF